MNIGFIGLGKLGLPCASVMAEKGHNVSGYDTRKIETDLIKIESSIESAVKNKDIVFVAVPTPHDSLYGGENPSSNLPPKDFSYDIVISVLKEANKFMNKNQLLVLISTVLPGTTRNLFVKLTSSTSFVYNPYLIAMGSVAWDMVHPEMVMIGTEDGKESGNAKKLIEFYKTLMENSPRYVVGTWDECESIKIFYNTFISTKLALVNMIQDVAEKSGNINVDVVTKALEESTMRIMGKQYMTAGMGDGGGCHPRDNIALRHMAKNLNLGYDIFHTIMEAREIQAKNLALKLVELSKENGNKPIYILGKAFKPGVSYIDGSYSLLIGHFCEEQGVVPIYVDPYTKDMPEEIQAGVFLLAHSSKVTYKYTGSAPEQRLYCEIPEKSIIVDPWRTFKKEDCFNCELIYYGNTRGK